MLSRDDKNIVPLYAGPVNPHSFSIFDNPLPRADLGVSRIVVSPYSGNPSEVFPALATIAAEVMPAVA